MIKNYLLLLLLTMFSIWLLAQEEGEEYEDDEMVEEEYYDEPEYNFKRTMLIGGNFQLGIPQRQLKRNLDKTSWGFGGSLLGKLRGDHPVFVGIDFSIQTFDSETLFEQELFNGVLEEFQITTKNHVMNTHFFVRYQPEFNFFIQPFVEGLLGAKWFYTRTVITDVNDNSGGNLSSDFDRGDWAASFGAAVGFQINLSRNYLFLEGRCAYLKGTSAEYLVRRADDPGGYINPIDAFEPMNSVTDLLIPQIGLKFLIGTGNQNEEEELLEEEY